MEPVALDAAAGPGQAVVAFNAVVVAASVVLQAVGGGLSYERRETASGPRGGEPESDRTTQNRRLTLVTVSALVSTVTAAGVGLVQVHAGSVHAHVGVTLVPI